jgi:hypothetical protein
MNISANCDGAANRLNVVLFLEYLSNLITENTSERVEKM